MASDSDNRPRYTVVASPDTNPEILRRDIEALARTRPSQPSSEPLFPRGPRKGQCRICGAFDDMTEEHIPPRGAGNKQRARDVPIDVVLRTEELELPDVGQPIQGGVKGHVLCWSCNNTTSQWGREYKRWATHFYELLASQPKLPQEIDEEKGYATFPEVVFREVYPGRLVRQVLSMMLTVSGSPELGERYPVLRRLVLGGAPEPLPNPLRLYFLLYGSSNGRHVGGSNGQAWYSGEEDVARRMLSVDFPPLAFILLVSGPPMTDRGIDISSFTEMGVDQKADLELVDLPLGFGHKAWPGEYRSRGQFLADGADPDEWS